MLAFESFPPFFTLMGCIFQDINYGVTELEPKLNSSFRIDFALKPLFK